MQPRRPARDDLQRLRRRAGGDEHRERVGLGVEGIDLGRGGRPVAANAGRLRERAAHAAGRGELVLGAVAAEDLSDLEQRHVGHAAIGVLLGGGEQPRNETRPHVGEVRRDGIGERKLRLAAAEQLGLRLGDERPGDRLDHSARAERALGLARTQLDGREHRLAWSLAAVERRRRDAIDAHDAHDLLHEIGLAVHIRPPGRHGHLDAPAISRHREAERTKHALDLRQVDLDAGQALSPRGAENRSRARAPPACPLRSPRRARRRRDRAPYVVASSSPGSMKAGSTPRSKR